MWHCQDVNPEQINQINQPEMDIPYGDIEIHLNYTSPTLVPVPQNLYNTRKTCPHAGLESDQPGLRTHELFSCR